MSRRSSTRSRLGAFLTPGRIALIRATEAAALAAALSLGLAFAADMPRVALLAHDAAVDAEEALERASSLEWRVDRAEAAGEDGVEDEGLVIELDRATDALATDRSSAVMYPEMGSGFSLEGAKESIRHNELLAKRLSASCDRALQAASAVSASAAERSARESREALGSALKAAEGTYDSSAGRVSGDATREALKARIDAARTFIDNGSWDVDGMDLATDAVKGAEETVKGEVGAWERVRAESIRAAAEFHGPYARAGSYRRGRAGAWNVSYRGTDDRSWANADGSLSEWKSGYYVAHSWSSNGAHIASRPGTVVVGGRTYRYVSSKVVPRGTTWGQVSGFVYANGGIGFQTCYGDGLLITHYEPV